MAQRYVTDEGVLVIPGAYPSIKVQRQNGGLATSGVLVLVGEASAGPDWSAEADLSTNFYAPTELSDVIQKYKSGNLVDAFRVAANPANDVNLPGAPSFIYLIKTNASEKASGILSRSGLSDYGVLADQSFGKLGNQTYGKVTEKTPEVAPKTGLTTYIPSPELGASDGSILALRVNGGAKQDVTVAALTAPDALVTALNAKTGINAVGGEDRGVLTGIDSAVTLAATASGSSLTIVLGSGTWTVTPSVGDTLLIPASSEYGATEASCIAGASSKNLGAYVVTAATDTSITALKLRDHNATGVTAPESVTATAIGAETTDILCYSPINIQNATGTDRSFLTDLVGKTVAGTATGKSLKLTLQTGSAWAALPQVGDYVYVASTAPAAIAGASNANVGWYIVTAATTGVAAGASTVTMTRLSNGNPVTFAATALVAVSDIKCLRPVIDGLGKSLEVYDDSSNVNVSSIFFTTSGSAATFLSTAAAPKVLTSSSEQAVTLTVSRQADGVSEEIDAGGAIVLKVGYNGTSATLTVGASTLTTSVVGGSGANLSLALSDFKRIADLAAYINSQTGYTAAVGSTLYGQLSPGVLDQGTFDIASDLGGAPARLKKDAYAFFNALVAESATVQLGKTTVARAASGLPEVQDTFFLSGGTLGATTAEGVANAVAKLASLRANFIVPLFSRDASLDVADGLTDTESTYTIDAIHAAVSSHVLEMSKFKRRRHRQAFLSFKGSFEEAKSAAQNIANYRCSMTFQDVKALSADGSIKQYQPWMGAVLAAGMQASGFYKSIVFKGVNCSGVVMADGSMTDQSDADLEEAITNGLLAMQRPENGGVRWNSDQTTYATDESFVYNSIQAIYAADIIALTVAQRMERQFVGQSVSDVSASVALSYLQGIMADMKRLKLIATSDDAPLGYKNAQIIISGNSMKVSMEIKLAGAILFIPISFLVSQVQQAA